MKSVTLERIAKTFSDGTRAVRGVDLAIEAGEFVVLLGPSGCGKTSTLRMIAGLETPSAGRVLLGNEDVTQLGPRERDVGFVFQFFALYPHLTVRGNIAFPLECSRVPPSERARRVDEVAERLGLAPLLAKRPRELSGGDQQRVALGRALVRRPGVWLMDEPLGTLDSGLRLELCEFLRAQQLEHRITTVYVTHDQEEAMRLADRIVVMSEGAILQEGRAARVYDEPASLFVARFVGSPGMNFIALSADSLAALPLPPAATARAGGRVTLGVRPESLALDPSSPLRGRIVVDEYLGSSRCLHVETPLGRLVARVGPDAPGARGSEVGLRLDPAHVRLFDSDSGRRLA